MPWGYLIFFSNKPQNWLHHQNFSQIDILEIMSFNLINLDQIPYLGIFCVTDNQSGVRSMKFEMADPIWRPKTSVKLKFSKNQAF